LRAEEWIKKQPEMQRLLKLQNRSAERLSHLHQERPGVEMRALRARRVYEGRCAKFTKVWLENDAFAQEVQTGFDSLSAVLNRDEVEHRKGELNWTDPFSVLQALRNAAQRLDEFWQCRPGQSATPAVGAGSGGGRGGDFASAARRRRRDEDDLAEVRAQVREMHAARFTHAQMCERLGNLPRPPMAKWRHLAWPVAFRSSQYRDAVKTKLSKLAHSEISGFPR